MRGHVIVRIMKAVKTSSGWQKGDRDVGGRYDTYGRMRFDEKTRTLNLGCGATLPHDECIVACNAIGKGG